MRRGSHAADDGSFNRSAVVNTGRAAILLVVAFLIGVGLLHSADRTAVTVSAATTTTVKATTTTTGNATTTTTAPLRDPTTIKVLSANGSTTNGVGDKMRAKLLAAKYDALTAVTATTKVPKTVVYYTPGFANEAAALAVSLGLPASAVAPMPAKPPVPALGTANMLVLIGSDQVAILTTGTTARATTTTAHSGTTRSTARATTTTTRSSSSSSTGSTTTTSHSGSTTSSSGG